VWSTARITAAHFSFAFSARAITTHARSRTRRRGDEARSSNSTMPRYQPRWPTAARWRQRGRGACTAVIFSARYLSDVRVTSSPPGACRRRIILLSEFATFAMAITSAIASAPHTRSRRNRPAEIRREGLRLAIAQKQYFCTANTRTASGLPARVTSQHPKTDMILYNPNGNHLCSRRAHAAKVKKCASRRGDEIRLDRPAPQYWRL
jgi:hypothetical protein